MLSEIFSRGEVCLKSLVEGMLSEIFSKGMLSEIFSGGDVVCLVEGKLSEIFSRGEVLKFLVEG